MAVPEPIRALNNSLKTWLFDHALPLWWEVGADHRHGGFHDRIDLAGNAVDGPRRARVAARQAWVYATAGRLGWTGPWQAAVKHAIDSLLGPFAREDDLFRILVDADGRSLEERPDPYEQAFALLAMSAAQQALGGDYEARAIRTREALVARVVEADGGVHDDETRAPPLRANPMMHLFEAVQAWSAVGVDPGWQALADTIADTALNRMIAPATGALCELYDKGWAAIPQADVEPGHQLEWGWLLLQHARAAGRRDPAAALRLIEIGETRGVENGVAIFSLGQDLQPRDRSARLWAQTERLHAHAATRNWQGVIEAADGLKRYLDVPVQGTWRDRLLTDGSFLEEAAPGSSLYHIVSAAAALDAACVAAS